MSGSARPEVAFAELERLVRSLGEELAFFRRRALEAERRWREANEHAPHGEGAPTRESLAARVSDLERENSELRSRLQDASDRTRQMADRLRFLRQQEGGVGER